MDPYMIRVGRKVKACDSYLMHTRLNLCWNAHAFGTALDTLLSLVKLKEICVNERLSSNFVPINL